VATEKLDLSLRLRHEDADLSSIARHLELKATVCWKKGDAQKAPDGTVLNGTRDSSYCSMSLDTGSIADLEEGLSECLKKLKPKERELRNFVLSGGMASIAVGWFCSGDTGDRIPEAVIAELANLRLTVDFYLYFATKRESKRKPSKGVARTSPQDRR
jgi:hypothetical protein